MLNFHLSDKEYVNEQIIRKGWRAKIINVLTFVSFSSGFSGSVVPGAAGSAGNYHESCDSCAGEGSEC